MIRYWWLGLIFIAMLLLPLFIGEFWVHVAIEILILGLFAVSFNMIFGYMGQLSFGHAAYFGVGAYATGLLLVKTSIPLPVCLAVSMVTAGFFALVIGYASLIIVCSTAISGGKSLVIVSQSKSQSITS